ncbi:MAG TPA: site-specific integrase, partial [Thermomicrobiales bacterium]|nr:site-specific integrase [Thermomicrobiales bacterium]
AVRGDRLEALYTVALALGLRQGEALGLRWQDLDLDQGLLQVRVALQQLPGRPPQLVEPKTPQSRRTLPLAPLLTAALRAHRARQLAERRAGGAAWHNAWELVFTRPDGRPLSQFTVLQQFHRHLARAGLPALRFHDLRHSCASLLVAQGVHPRVIMELLGHSTITVTMNTYSHVLPQAQRDAATAMAGLLQPLPAAE